MSAVRGALWLAAVGVLALGGCAAWRLQAAADLAARSEAWQQQPASPRRNLLIVGDSTGVGTGASAGLHSLAGLIGQAYPDVQIVNRARDGATFADVVAQLGGVGRFDMVLVLAGGNDVIRLRAWSAVQADVDRVVQLASQHAPQVVLMPAGNVGNAPFFFAPLSWWMSRRSRELHRIVDAAARRGATVVNLYQDAADDPFVQQPALNARDGLHPSDAGYRVWFTELQRQANLPRWLGAAG